MNFQELLREYNIPSRTEGNHSRPGWVQIDCPFCGKDSNKWHMGYNLQSKYVNCWRCGSHSLIEVVSIIAKIPFSKAKKLIDLLPGQTFQEEKRTTQLILPKGLAGLSKPHKQYLRQRGCNPKTIINQWEVQGIEISSNLSWRIFIPIFYEGRMVSWTTRSIGNHPLRYISASTNQEEISHKFLLYGQDYAKDTIIITEGPFDVWRIGPGAVATLGLSFTQEQIRKMLKFPRRAVCFDNEKVAQEKARHLADQLSVFPGETYLFQLDAKDAGEASDREIRKLRKFIER